MVVVFLTGLLDYDALTSGSSPHKMNNQKSQSAIMIGVLFSIAGLAMAVAAWHALTAQNYGNTLIFAGGALASSLAPLSGMRPSQFRQSLNELAIDAIRNPPPLGLRLLYLLCWVLVISGVVVSILKA
jgi:hypothetical protein